MRGLVLICLVPIVIASAARQSRRYAWPIGMFARHSYGIAASFLLAMTNFETEQQIKQ